MSSGRALHAAGLTKSYGDVPALGPIDLDIATGERVVLLGHNGSGKTTLLRLAAGLLDVTAGTVSIAGHPAGSLEARAFTSYLGDQPVFYDDLTVWEHLEYIARLHDTDGWEQHAADLLEHLGLTSAADDLPTTFSRGLRQKAAIAIAFVRPFEVLLVDEPFVGLDQPGRAGAARAVPPRPRRRRDARRRHPRARPRSRAAERVVALRDGEVHLRRSGRRAVDAAALVVR